MNNYLTELTGHPAFERLSALNLPPVCPFLFYNLCPYIYTLARDGWFDWVPRAADPARRKKPGSTRFTRKTVNCNYVNEVLVRCPNPHGLVVAGAGPWTGDRICLRILHREGPCPYDHRPGPQVVLDKTGAERLALHYFRLFPEVLLEIRADIGPAEAAGLMTQGGGCPVRASEIIHPCRYHRHPKTYNSARLLPDDCCPHVFWRLYPQVLGRMYHARPEPPMTFPHPDTDKSVTAKIEKKPEPKNPARRAAERLADFARRLLRRPADRLDYSVIIHCLENAVPGCPFSQGGRYQVNLHSQAFLCPAAFFSLYPFLLSAAAGSPVTWDMPEAGTRVCCPDCIGAVYELGPPRLGDG